jgi:hypothetical protein
MDLVKKNLKKPVKTILVRKNNESL